MYFVIVAALLCFQPVFPQECRQVTVCNETPRDVIKGDKGDIGNAGKAGPEGRKGETGSIGKKGEKGLQGESCALGSFGTNINNKLAGSYYFQSNNQIEVFKKLMSTAYFSKLRCGLYVLTIYQEI